LNDFYVLNGDLSAPEILNRHRATLEIQPELTWAAGLAYRSFTRLRSRARQLAEAETTTALEATSAPARRGGRRGRVVARVRPDQAISVRRLAEALMAHAKELAKRDHDDPPE
jgi:hypothetical protein